MGLAVSRVAHYGYALTAMAEATADRYQVETWALDQALIHRRKPIVPTGTTGPPTGGDEDGEEEDKKPASRLRKATCGCDPPFIIRVAKKTIADTTIRCESCGKAFRLA